MSYDATPGSLAPGPEVRRGSVLGPVTGAAAVPGELRMLACPSVLCPHAEFAISRVLDAAVSLTWSPQPASVDGAPTLQATLAYIAASGSAGHLATKLRTLGPVSFEIVEAAAPGVDAERYSYHPDLGLHRATLSACGDVMLSESIVSTLLGDSAGQPASVLAHGLDRLLGRAWDELLEPLRAGSEGAPVSALRRTG